jgi:hypothetical protein
VKLTAKSRLKSLPFEDTQSNCQPMRRWKALDLRQRRPRDGHEVMSRCARCTFMPSAWSAMNEQLGQPCSQPGPSMKCCTSSWRRPSNSSASVRRPGGVSKT